MRGSAVSSPEPYRPPVAEVPEELRGLDVLDRWNSHRDGRAYWLVRRPSGSLAVWSKGQGFRADGELLPRIAELKLSLLAAADALREQRAELETLKAEYSQFVAKLGKRPGRRRPALLVAPDGSALSST